jgi:hypothetical protein
MMPFDVMISTSVNVIKNLLNNQTFGLQAILTKITDTNYNAYEAYTAANAAKDAANDAVNAVNASVPATGAVVDYIRKSSGSVSGKLDCAIKEQTVQLPTDKTYTAVVDLQNVMFIPYNNEYNFDEVWIVQQTNFDVRVTINDDVLEFKAPSNQLENRYVLIPPFEKIKRFKVELKQTANSNTSSAVVTVAGRSSNSSLLYINW